MSDTVDIVLVTGRDMAVEDAEAPKIVAAMRDRGISAELRPWGADVEGRDARLVLIRSTWDYTWVRDEFLAWVRGVDAVTRIMNPASVIEWNSHKGYLFELAGAGVPVVPTTLLARGSSAEAQRKALAEVASAVVVVKPAVDAGARGAQRGAADSPEIAAHLATFVAQGDVMVQPFVDSITTSGETSLIYFGGELSHAVRKIPAADDYRVQQHLGGRTESHDPTSAERAVAERALSVVPEPVAYARVDLVVIDDEPAVMELELIEPYLFLEYADGSVDRFIDTVIRELR